MNNVAGLLWEMKERAGWNSRGRNRAVLGWWNGIWMGVAVLEARQTVWRNSTG
jgi:hypothetical protein